MIDDLLGATLDAEELPRHQVARGALCLAILFHPDTRRIGEVACGLPKTVSLSRLEPLFAPPGQSAEPPLADLCLSSRAEIEQCRDECQGRVVAMAQKLEVSERALKLRMGDLGIS